jgi:ABC-2 type transport system ATP-binding protein
VIQVFYPMILAIIVDRPAMNLPIVAVAALHRRKKSRKQFVPDALVAYCVAMLVTVERLTKTYGNFKAVDDVSFVVQPGEIAGLVGPNGAGKTTIIHVMLGLILPNAGIVRLFAKSLETDREQILQRLNFTSPYMAFPARLTVFENLKVFARIYNVRDPAAKIIDLLERFGIGRLRHKPISRLSSGETMRVGLCKAFLNNPELLLLDEPTAYLDLQAALQVREVLLDLQRSFGTTILYTSHNMHEVQRMCDRVIFLRQGRIVATGTPIEVTRKVLQEDRDAPALDEVFIRIAGRQADEAVPN